jgi:hypothetical protein
MPGHAAGASLNSSGRSAFSLIEIMVTVGLLSFIVLGLVAMFSQTQRAFRSSLTQVDVLEGGRAVTDMMARELAEITPSYLPFTTNVMGLVDTNHLQELPGTSIQRTNEFERFFFLTRFNTDWTGIGYQVVPDAPGAGVGTLYRHVATARRYNARLLSSNFVYVSRNGLLTNRIVDGVVHFKVTPFAKNGYPIVSDFGYTNAFYTTNRFYPRYFAAVANADTSANVYFQDRINFNFFSNSVPAYLELELGILEKQALEQFHSLPTNNATLLQQFLSTRSAQVHLFRQRIPIRNVDLSVYQ